MFHHHLQLCRSLSLCLIFIALLSSAEPLSISSVSGKASGTDKQKEAIRQAIKSLGFEPVEPTARFANGCATQTFWTSKGSTKPDSSSDSLMVWQLGSNEAAQEQFDCWIGVDMGKPDFVTPRRETQYQRKPYSVLKGEKGVIFVGIGHFASSGHPLGNAEGYFVCGNVLVHLGHTITSPNDLSGEENQAAREAQAAQLDIRAEAAAKALMAKFADALISTNACQTESPPVLPADMSPHNPKEVDALLNKLGMMLAVAAAAPPPAWGLGRMPQNRPAFTWDEAAVVAHTVLIYLEELQNDAGRRFRVELTDEQVRRIKSFLHWVKWVDRRAKEFDVAGLRALGYALTHVQPEGMTDEDVIDEFIFKLAPPEYPLSGPVRADIKWPDMPLPVVSDFDRYLMIGQEFLPAAALMAAFVADLYFGGCWFVLLVTAVEILTSELIQLKNLTPIAWMVIASSKIKIGGVPIGAFIVPFLIAEGILGKELQLIWVSKAEAQNRLFPIKSIPFTLEVRQLDADPNCLPWERIGKFAMAVLPISLALKRLEAGRAVSVAEGRSAILNRQPTQIDIPGTALKGEPVVLTYNQSIPAAELSGSGGSFTARQLKVSMAVLERDSLFFHPETGELLPIEGTPGSQAFQQAFKRYPFGKGIKIEAYRTDGSAVEIPREQWGQIFEETADGQYQVREQVRTLNKNGELMVAGVDKPAGLLEVFGSTPRLQKLAGRLTLAFQSADAGALQAQYLAFINEIIVVFGAEGQTFVMQTSAGEITIHIIPHDGYALYIAISSQGELLNATLLSSNSKASALSADYFLQQANGSSPPLLPASQPPEVTLVASIVNNLTYDPNSKLDRLSGSQLPEAAAEQQRLLNDSLKEDLTGRALSTYLGFGPRRLPVNNGSWLDKQRVGNSAWQSTLEKVNRVTGGDPVPFKDGYPDFSRWMRDKVELSKMTGNNDKDFNEADKKFAKKMSKTDPDRWLLRGEPNAAEASRYRQRERLTWHHVEDLKTMMLVPTDLHSIPHSGGASLARILSGGSSE
jgi:colicin-lik colicin-like DNase/tRNase family protein